MLKRIVKILITVMVLVLTVWHVVIPPKWQSLYTRALLSGDISLKNANYLLLADFNYDGTPELIVQCFGSGGYVYGINNRRVESHGYTGLNELGLYKSKPTGELLWISKYRIDYKYGYTECIDEVHYEANKVTCSNIFTYNEDVRGGDMVYWEYKGKLMGQKEYRTLYNNYWGQMKIENKPVPLLHLDNLNEAMINEWMDSWRAVNSFQHD